MTSIRAVVADFAGVLYSTPKLDSIRRTLRLLGVREPGFLSLMHASPRESQHVMDLCTGVVSEQDLWNEIARNWGIHPVLLGLLRSSGYAPWKLQRRLAAYLRRLRPQHHTAILTNAGTDFRDTFCRTFRLEKMVDQVIISAEEGLAKPDPTIYLLAAQRLGVQPQEVVFFDDMLENVEGARQAGMQAFHHINTRQTIQTLDGILE